MKRKLNMPQRSERSFEMTNFKEALFLQVSEDRVRIKMSPVRVLNVLGDNGYRVIGASSAGRDGAYAWTLEKKKFSDNGVGSGDLESGSSRRPQSEFNHADRYGRGRGY